MKIEGSIEGSGLFDLLQFIMMGRKDGGVIVRNEEKREKGEMFFKEGLLLHAEAGNLKGIEAVKEIMQWNKGKFVYDSEKKTSKATIGLPLQQVLLDVAREIDEWSQIKKIIPDTTYIPVIVENPNIEQDTITLQSGDWKVLTLIDGKKNIDKIAEELKTDKLEIAKIVFRLMSAGLIDLHTPKGEKKRKRIFNF